MAKNTQKMTKYAQYAKRELDQKKAKRNKIATLSVAIVFGLALVTLLTIGVIHTLGTKIYTDGSQSVQLLPGGKFTATISHGDQYSGTYTKTKQDDSTVITYTTDNGSVVSGEIIGKELNIPEEWLDDHGHNATLPLK